jgi:hypothetical protein
MPACGFCEQEITTAASCTVQALHVRGRRVPMIPWGRERGWARSLRRCGDCGVLPKGFHHLGCDIQECPQCHGQMFSCGCRFDEDPPDDDDDHDVDDREVLDVFIDSNGCLTEVVLMGDQEVVIHYDDVPAKDITEIDGIPVTTALRTVIDLAPETAPDHLRTMLDDCLTRELFTIEEARARIAEDDMRQRPGAILLAKLLE